MRCLMRRGPRCAPCASAPQKPSRQLKRSSRMPSSHQHDLWQKISGILTSPDEKLREAFFAAPRHHFVERYRRSGEKDWSIVAQGCDEGHLARIYEDEPLVLSGASDFAFVSSCSQPSYILNLVDWLGV